MEELDFNISLETERIRLRPVFYDDIIPFSKITNDSNMWVYFINDLSNNDELKKWVDVALTQQVIKFRLAFTIIDKLTDKIVGSSSFGNISYVDKRIEIGWTWIGKDFQGKGINDQAKLLMIGYCFEKLNFERVEFKTDVLNKHARNALERIGMVEEGVLRSHSMMVHNRRRDTIYYSILKSEWNAVKTKNNWFNKIQYITSNVPKV